MRGEEEGDEVRKRRRWISIRASIPWFNCIWFLALTFLLLVTKGHGEKEWSRLCGKTIRSLEELEVHNQRLPPAEDVVDVGLRLRVLTYNIHNFRGYPEELAEELWTREPEKRLTLPIRTLGMLDAHLISLQECAHEKKLQLELIERLGYSASFFRASHHRHCAGAFLTRFSLLDSVNLTFLELDGEVKMKRFLGRSLIQLPGGQQLLFYGGHYDPSPEEELRLCEEVMRLDRKLGRPMIWLGDWNITRTHSSYRWFQRMGLIDAFVHLGLPHTTTGLKGDRSRGGIDYIFCTPDIADRLQSIEIVNRGPATVDPNDSQSVAASDHLPVLAVFRF
jgi:endonuclease/exonuclease/phosphatase family metal-dependent hydrolase